MSQFLLYHMVMVTTILMPSLILLLVWLVSIQREEMEIGDFLETTIFKQGILRPALAILLVLLTLDTTEAIPLTTVATTTL